MMQRKDRFGINMKEWCRKHEGRITSEPPAQALLDIHREKIRCLQHERLVHLIVTVMCTFIELFFLDLTILHPETGIYPPLFLLGFAVLLGFYYYHYFFLENTVQRWYRMEDEMREKLKDKG